MNQHSSQTAGENYTVMYRVRTASGTLVTDLTYKCVQLHLQYH